MIVRYPRHDSPRNPGSNSLRQLLVLPNLYHDDRFKTETFAKYADCLRPILRWFIPVAAE
jgi:hypothetical protein